MSDEIESVLILSHGKVPWESLLNEWLRKHPDVKIVSLHRKQYSGANAYLVFYRKEEV